MSKEGNQESNSKKQEKKIQNIEIDMTNLPKFIQQSSLPDSLFKLKKYEEEKFILYDFSFGKRYEEDNYYKDNPILIDKIRRGNSILVFKDQNFSIEYAQLKPQKNQSEGKIIIASINGNMKIARRGLQKFFDLDGSYIERNINIGSTLAENEYSSAKIQDIIFSEIKAKNCPVRVYRMEKANGENCQIAYNEDLDLWLICSKNVCMPVRNINDVEKFKKKKSYQLENALTKNQIMAFEQKESINNENKVSMEVEISDQLINQEQHDNNDPHHTTSKEFNCHSKNEKIVSGEEESMNNFNKIAMEIEISKQLPIQANNDPHSNDSKEFIGKKKNQAAKEFEESKENEKTTIPNLKPKKAENNLDRFSFASLFAEFWFDKLDKLEQQAPGTVAQLKNDLKNKCLIGEYCGNNEHQHLILYEKIQIKFYAIVELTNSIRSCLPPSQALEFLDKYQLTKVDIKETVDCVNFIDLNKQLKITYEKVCSSSIEDEGEGNVLYFVELNEKMEETNVLSLCKLKTTNYRLFRKMREKLKRMLFDKTYIKGKQKRDPLNSFKNEIGQFLKDDNEEINFYGSFCSRLFEYSKYLQTNKKITEEDFKKLIEEKYASYITFIMYCLYKETALTDCNIKLMMDETFLNNEINKFSWSEYMNLFRQSEFFKKELIII